MKIIFSPKPHTLAVDPRSPQKLLLTDDLRKPGVVPVRMDVTGRFKKLVAVAS